MKLKKRGEKIVDKDLQDVDLGAKYRDKVTGFTGTATAKTLWMNGCLRVLLEAPHKGGSEKLEEGQMFDVGRLERVPEPPVPATPRSTGGGGRPDSLVTSR